MHHHFVAVKKSQQRYKVSRMTFLGSNVSIKMQGYKSSMFKRPSLNLSKRALGIHNLFVFRMHQDARANVLF